MTEVNISGFSAMMVWYGTLYADLLQHNVAKVSNALCTLYLENSPVFRPCLKES